MQNPVAWGDDRLAGYSCGGSSGFKPDSLFMPGGETGQP